MKSNPTRREMRSVVARARGWKKGLAVKEQWELLGSDGNVLYPKANVHMTI